MVFFVGWNPMPVEAIAALRDDAISVDICAVMRDADDKEDALLDAEDAYQDAINHVRALERLVNAGKGVA